MTTDLSTPPEIDPLIHRADLAKAHRVTVETINNWIKRKTLPPPDQVQSSRSVYWRRSTLVAAGVAVP